MVADAARVAHAGGGDYHLRLRVLVYGAGFVHADGDLQPVESERVHSAREYGAGLVVEERGIALQENARGLDGQRAVDVDLEAVVAVYQAALLYLADEVQHLLRPADGEGGNHDVAAPVQRTLDYFRQRADVVRPAVRVKPVAVGALDNDVVRIGYGLRVAQYRLVHVAHVA